MPARPNILFILTDQQRPDWLEMNPEIPIRTPHLLFNAMAILDALEVDYEVVGGPGACCGIIQ